MKYRLGIDVGGTFTDLAVHEATTDSVRQFKSVTTPDSRVCVRQCLDKAARSFGDTVRDFLASVELVFCFGSTIGLNTLLTGAGDAVGMLTTKGHRDTYRIAEMDRGNIASVRDAAARAFKPLIPRERIAEVAERVEYTGNVIIPLDETEVRQALKYLVEEKGTQALVITFLWAHRNAAHEHRAREIAEELYPDLFVSCGADLTGTLGEFKRAATAVVNAYIGRAVKAQAEALADALRAEGLKTPMLVMQSLGGVAPLEQVLRQPVGLLKSGPSGGAVGAAALASELALQNVVCMDMGGTSCDISTITEGEVELSSGFTVLGHPIAISGVEIESVGAGGGSIAVLETAGGVERLRVGPESAGSEPGPACYARGGQEPTVTDANVVLGLIDPTARLGGELRLEPKRAYDAIASHIAGDASELRVLDAAWGMYQVITAQMADAIEGSMVAKGLEPSRYTLATFGAAGAIHAAGVAARLGIAEVVVPRFFPVFSAFGLMMTDIRHSYNLTDDSIKLPVDTERATVTSDATQYVKARLSEVARLPADLLEAGGVPVDARALELFLDLRYSGQFLELPVRVDAAALNGSDFSLAALLEDWKRKYVRVYGPGAAWSTGDIEIINYRAIGVGRIARPTLPRVRRGANESPCDSPSIRRIYLGRWLDADVWEEDQLLAGMTVNGPAIVQGALRTAMVGPGDELSVDEGGNFRLRCHGTWL